VGLGLALLAASLVGAATFSGGWQSIEQSVEAVVLARAERPWNPRVVLIAIDGDSYRELHFPFSRRLYARVIDALTAAGAKAVGLDFFFNSEDVNRPPGDEELAAAFRAHPNVVLAVPCDRGEVPSAERLSKMLSRSLPTGPTPAIRCETMITPYGPLDGASWVAHVTLARTRSSQNIGHALFADVGERRLPSLAALLYGLGEGAPPQTWRQTPRGAWIGSLFVPVDAQGNARAGVRTRVDDEHLISFLTLARALPADGPARFPEELARAIRGRYVLIGNTTPILNDLGPGPDGKFLPLVLMHASFLSDLLEGSPFHEAPPALVLALIFALGLISGAAAIYTRPAIASVAVVVVLVGIAGAAMTAARAGLVVPVVGPAVASALAFLLALSGNLFGLERERRILRDAFSNYVDPGVMARILEQPERYLAFGGARKKLTVLFSDVKGYTSMSNQRPPEEVIQILREYLREMTHLVRRHGGRIDKIMGDGIMAVFGDPVPNEEHALSAVRAAVEMQQALMKLRARWTEIGGGNLEIRIGVATGEVFVGNIGSEGAKLEYTVLGATVNLAARLENKAPPGSVLVSLETRDACAQAFDFQATRPLKLKGFEETYDAFLLVGVKEAVSAAAPNAG
jgi:adenylate cyclase